MTFKSARQAAILLLLGTLALPAFSQDRHDEDRGERREDRPSQRYVQPRMNRPAKGQRAMRMEHDRHPRQTTQRAHEWQQRRGWAKEGAWQAHENWEANRAAHWDAEHRTWAQRGGYGGYYVPRRNFRLYFGRDHWFRIRTRPLIYMGYPRFVYRNYSFMMVDPWPEEWGVNWYESDDVYIDYSDGYYLYNRRHPGAAVAVTIVR